MSSEPLTQTGHSIRHGYAQIGGVRLHYAERGAGPRLVILLHGFPECWYSWRHQLAALGDDYHVVAPDLRGYNLSEKPARVADYRMEALVADVLGLIHHFGQERAAIVGHDWGAGIAWTIALQYPEYVSHLVAMQVPPAPVWLANLTLKQLFRSWYMFFFQLPRLPEWVLRRDNFRALERLFKERHVKPQTINESDIAVYKAALREPGALAAAINYYRANIPPLVRRGLAERGRGRERDRVHVPTLFIYGERDQAIVPETVRNVGAYVAAPYRELRLARCSHWVQQEAAAEVNQALRSFLDAGEETS